jgi:hypothetical protein
MTPEAPRRELAMALALLEGFVEIDNQTESVR